MSLCNTLMDGKSLRLLCVCHPKRCHGDGIARTLQQRVGSNVATIVPHPHVAWRAPVTTPRDGGGSTTASQPAVAAASGSSPLRGDGGGARCAGRRVLETIQKTQLAFAEECRDTVAKQHGESAKRATETATFWRRRLEDALRCTTQARSEAARPAVRAWAQRHWERYCRAGYVPAEYGSRGERNMAFHAELRRVFEGDVPPEERRQREVELCRKRLADAEAKLHERVAEDVNDTDRIFTRLINRLDALRGGAPVWDVFKVIGETRADLVGKKAKPQGGGVGMHAVSDELPIVDGKRVGVPVTGTDNVIAAIQRLAGPIHSERGGSPSAVAWLMQQLDRTEAARRRGGDGEGAEGAGGEQRAEAEAVAEEGVGEAEWVEAVLTWPRFQEALTHMRREKGVGSDGWNGWLLAISPESVRREYFIALQDVARELGREARHARATAGDGARAAAYTSAAAIEATRRAAPEAWWRWESVLLPKPNEDPTVFARRRDIWLPPHGLKLLTIMTRAEYDSVAYGQGPRGMAGAVPLGQGGFAFLRNAGEATLALSLQREMAFVARTGCYRGYCDLAGFFMSISRNVQHEVESRAGVRPDVTDVIFALQAATQMRYDIGAGLTPGVPSERGVGQGTTDGPRRSTLLLAQMQRAVDALVAGFEYPSPWLAEGTRVPCVFFADGGFGTDSFAMLQLVFDVISTVARAQGLEISVKPDGSKTAWSGLEYDPGGGGAWTECDDGRYAGRRGQTRVAARARARHE